MTRALVIAAMLGMLPSLAGTPDATAADRVRASDDFGRLFSEPAQRVTRKSNATRTPRVTGVVKQSTDGEINGRASTFHLNGVAIDGAGHVSIWVNGERYDSEPAMRVSALDTPGRIQIAFAGGAPPIELRVGQWLDRTSQKVSESFEARRHGMVVDAESTAGAAVAAEPIAAVPATSPSPRAKRPRAPALHLHVHTATPGARRKPSRREDD